MQKKTLALLKVLHNNQGFVSGEEISQKLGVSRTTIWKHINYLREEGFQIEAVTNKGYRLLKIPDKLVAEEIAINLRTEVLGKEIYTFDSLPSTNIKAKELARDGCPEGTIVLAEEQTKGKGRMGRKWYSPPGSGLWLSIILRPKLTPDRAPFLTMVAGLALVKALKEEIKVKLELKWPNDVLLAGKKVAGILSELSAEMEKINYAIVGIGLNVNQDHFPGDLNEIATSLYLARGSKMNRNLLLRNILEQFDGYYQKLMKGKYQLLLEEWQEELNILGKEVVIISSDRKYRGKVLEISNRGELLLEDDKGKKHTFWAGDVSLRREKNR